MYGSLIRNYILAFLSLVIATPAECGNGNATTSNPWNFDSLTDLKATNVSWPPRDFYIQWEPATGMAAGTYVDTDAWLLALRCVLRAAAEPLEENIDTQSLRDPTGNMILNVSGWPAGSLVKVTFVLWGFWKAMFMMGLQQRYEYGRYYLVWEEERRGFIEFKEIEREKAAQGTLTPGLSHPPLTDETIAFRHEYRQEQPQSHHSYYFSLLDGILQVAEGGINQEAHGFIFIGFATQGLRCRILDGGQQTRMTNRLILRLFEEAARLPSSFNPPQYVKTIVTMFYTGPEGERDLASIEIGLEGTALEVTNPGGTASVSTQ